MNKLETHGSTEKMEMSDEMNAGERPEELLARMREAVRLFSLFFRLPILPGRRGEMPLAEFRQRAVFMEHAQPFYRKEYLTALLAGEQRGIRVLDDPLGTHTVILLADDTAVFWGPFVSAPYQEKNCRRLVSRFACCDSKLLLQFKLFWCDLSVCEPDTVIHAVQTVLQYTGYSPDDFPVRRTQTVKRGEPIVKLAEEAELSPWRLGAVQKIEERYAIENELMVSISEGREEAALGALGKLLHTSAPQIGMTVELWPQESATAIMRNIIRLGAKRSGLSAAVIDSISMDYAQKMHRITGGSRAAAHLYEEMISDLCREIRLMKESGFSSTTLRALHTIQKHCAEPVSIGALAKSLRISESTLARSLKADTGHTFTQLLKTERMNTAARLLASTSEPVQVIASRVGILDQNYFAKLFYSVYQVTPSQYRSLTLSGTSVEVR